MDLQEGMERNWNDVKSDNLLKRVLCAMKQSLKNEKL